MPRPLEKVKVVAKVNARNGRRPSAKLKLQDVGTARFEPHAVVGNVSAEKSNTRTDTSYSLYLGNKQNNTDTWKHS